MNENHLIEPITQIKHACELSNEAHTCLFCGTQFVNKNDLELHSHLHNKNKSFVCLLCKEVFPELKLLKLHDLRHSLEEAHEEMSGIENLLSPLTSSLCRVCGEGFSCDEEFVDHYVTNHKTVENANSGLKRDISNDDLSSDSCDSSGEEQTNYPLLREEIVTENGVMHVRFTLIDHPNVQVGEFVRMVEHKISKKKGNLKSQVKPKKMSKILENEMHTKKSNVKSSSTSKLNHKGIKPNIKDRKKIPELGLVPKKSSKAKIAKMKSTSLPEDKNTKKKINPKNEVLNVSSDSDVEILFENSEKNTNVKRPRHSKLLALKKKIWKSNPNLSVPPKVCHTCQKSFTSVEEYGHHLLSHKKYSCRKCYQVFHTATLLHRHTMLHHAQAKRNSYQCETCRKEFSSVISWKTHQKCHMSNREIECSKCDLQFKSVEHLNKHDCKFTKTTCRICKYKFPRLFNLRRHLTSVHKLSREEVKQLLEVSAQANNDSSVLPENDQELKESKQDTEVVLDKENKSTESSTEANNSLLNGKVNEKRVSLPDFSPVSSERENEVSSSLEKKQLPAGNINLNNVVSSNIVKKSFSNKKEIAINKKSVLPGSKTSKLIKKTDSKKTVKNSTPSKQIPTKLSISKKTVKKLTPSKQIPTKLSISKKTVKNSSSSKQSPTKLPISKKSVKNIGSLKQIPTKLSASNKQFKKTKVSVPYLSKGNAKQSVKELLINKNKKKTIIDSKKSLSRTKTFSKTSQKNKLNPKKMR